MKRHTTVYRLKKDGQTLDFHSEREACDFLGVAKCSVASCYRRNGKCKGWEIVKIGSSTHGGTKSRLFKIWSGMHERCERENHKHYENYGGRGITVCNEWSDFATFEHWATETGYKDGLSIDRVDVDGNYTPANCRWATMREQQNNRRNNRKIEYNGEIHTVTEWAEITGIGKTTIKERLNMGWGAEKTLTFPIRPRTTGHRASVGYHSIARMDGGADSG